MAVNIACRKPGIICEHGANPCNDSIGLPPHLVNACPRCRVGNPLRIALARGDLSVKTCGHFQSYERTACFQVVGEPIDKKLSTA